MELKMEVYTSALELIRILEIQRSVIANTAAFSAGSFSIYSLITDETRELLQPENIVAISDDAAGIIEHVEEESDERGPYITIKGRLLSGILDRRILWGLYDLTGTPAAIMRYLVYDCAINPTRGRDAEDIERRKIPGLVLADGYVDSGAKIRKQITGGSLLEALEELGETYQVAFGIRVNPKTQLMEFWTRNGVDRSIHQLKNDPVFFSTELDDVLSSAYTYDSKNYRNIALVAGEGEGLNRTSTVVEKFEDTPAPPAVETCTITLTVDPAGTGTVIGGGEVRVGRKTTVKAEPSSGYEFSAWKQGTNTVSTSESYTFTATEDTALTAVFAVIVPTYYIQTAIDPAGGGTASGAGYYKQGNSVTLTASPANGFKFVAWRENGSNVSTNTTYTFTASDNRTITAVFVAVYTVTTAVDPAGSGTATGAGSYDAGATVTLTATPSTGYKFVAWMENGSQISTNASYTFAVSENTTVTAVFVVIPRYTITTEIEPTGAGAVTGAGTYAEGTNVTLVATPESGFDFVSWQENGVEVSASLTYTFIASGNRTITAVFVGELPTGYTKLPYLQSKGNYSQCIDTGIIPDETTKCEGKFELTYRLNNKSVFGMYIYQNNKYKQFRIFPGYGTSAQYQNGTMNTNYMRCILKDKVSDIIINIQEGEIHTFSVDAESGKFTIDDLETFVENSSETYGGAVSIYLFCSHNSVQGDYSYMRLYEFTIYKGGVKVRDFVPCSNPSNVKGLYDKVSKTFFTNLGAGYFE